MEDAWIEDVAPHYRERARRILRAGLFDDGADPALALVEGFRRDDAIAAGRLTRDILHRDHARAGRFGRVGHLLQRAVAAVPDQVIRKDHREWFVADDRFRAQHRMTQTKGFGLGHEHRAHAFWQDVADQLKLLLLAG